MATTLNGREVTANVSVDDLARPYKSTNPLFVGKTYHVGRWGTRGFNCSPEFYKAFKAGRVEQLTLEETIYKRKDDATGIEVDVPSASLVTWLTLEQVLGLDKNETAKIEAGTMLAVAKAKSKIAVKGAELAALKEFGITMEEMKQLQAIA